MKPHEILQKIIDSQGSCDWIEFPISATCDICPLGGENACAGFVNKTMKGFTNADYLDAAKRVLADLEAGRIILGEDLDI